MSIIITDGNDCCEKQLLNNWAAEYAKRAISEHRSYAVIDHPDGSVTSEKIADGAVQSSKIASGSVTSEKIADSAVQSSKIESGSITSEKIADRSVTDQKIADGAVGTEKIAGKAVTADKIADYSVGQMQLAQASVSNNRIQNDAIDTRTISEGAVTPEKLDRKYLVTQSVSMITGETDIPPENDARINISAISSSEGGDTKVYHFYAGYDKSGKHIWKSPVFKGEVATTDIKDGAITPEKTSFASYSSKPVKIGEWIDGTPVWRVAFDIDLPEDDLAWSEKTYTFKPPVTDYSGVVTLSKAAWLRKENMDLSYNAGCIDIPNLFAFDLYDFMTYQSGYRGIYGYVEFATPESNIKEA